MDLGSSKVYKTFTFDAGAVVALGRDSIKDNTTAIVELVKNSYDADSPEVLVEIVSGDNGYIRIADSGTGMTEDDIDKNWLRIGFSEKRTSKKSKLSRRKTGEKGIGRLSAYRLGNKLKLTTRGENNVLFSMQVNWQEFERSHIDAEKVQIELLINQQLLGPNQLENEGRGTELLILDLRQQWSEDDIRELYRELKNISPPFHHLIDSFRIVLKNDLVSSLNGCIDPPENKPPLLELKADYDGVGNFYYKIYEPKLIRNKIQSRVVEEGSLKQDQLISVKDQPDFWGTNVGSFSLILRFYLQKKEYLSLVDIKQKALRDYLELNSGIKIYRDGIRVKPYGDSMHPDGDWLGLDERKSRDPAGAGRSSFKLANRQVVGGVFISRDENVDLVDSSSREGLQNGDAFHELKSLMGGCINLMESYYHKTFKKSLKGKVDRDNAGSELKSNVADIARLAADISSSVKVLVKDVPDISDALEDIIHRADEVEKSAKDVQGDVEQLASQATIYRSLATIGITTAVFGHEIQSSISQLLLSLKAANMLLPKSDDVSVVRTELIKAAESADTVNAWGKFALSRVNRDKRRRKKLNVKRLVEQVAKEMDPILGGSGVQLSLDLKDVQGKYFAMDIESIVMNLLSNAYFACKQKKTQRKIQINLGFRKTKLDVTPVLSVSDSGPGVPRAIVDQIFEPLFTTKSDARGKPIGTGLGLSIVSSILDDIKGEIKVDKDPRLKGARFTVTLG